MSEAAREVVVVGAGAVGAVYARHLQRAGARLTFLVRAKYADELRANGIRLYRGRTEETLRPDDVVTSVDALKDRALDQVWLCVPSTGLTDDDVTRLGACTGDALIVDLRPGFDRKTAALVGEQRLVEAIIPFIAYQSPLHTLAGDPHPSERERAPGIAYWLPPLVPTNLASSSPAAADRVATLLKRGGMSARVVSVDDIALTRASGMALLTSVIATLEASDWRLGACRRRLDAAVREAVDVAARMQGRERAPFALRLASSPAIARALLTVAPWIAPLPLEDYLAYHFTKVRAQGRQALTSLLAAADTQGPAAPHLAQLVASLPALPRPDAAAAHVA